MDSKDSYPPEEEVACLWEASRWPIGDFEELSGYQGPSLNYLDARGIAANSGWEQELFRVVPEEYEWPSWWPFEKRSKTKGVWTIIVAAWTPKGVLASIHARAKYSPSEMQARGLDPGDKTRWPSGHKAGGLLFACSEALHILRGEPTSCESVWVCEGITDWLAAAVAVRESSLPIAVLGGTSGSFRALEEVVWPTGIRLYSCVDPDPAGEKYHEQILQAVGSKVDVFRPRFAELEALVAA